MSPVGKAESNLEARGQGSLASKHLSAPTSASLPLRLSVARGGLGLEVFQPIQVGALVVEELEVALPGLDFPLDLSKGVKHFRNRRSILRHAVVRVDTAALAEKWGEALTPTWGEGVKVRLRPVFERAEPEAATPESNENVGAGVPALAVTVHRDRRALAFDLVVTSGTAPRLAIAAPRALGCDSSPLHSAMQVIDAGLRAASDGAGSSPALSFSRKGRAIEMAGLAEALVLMVLPALGCRLPSVQDQVVREVRHERGQIYLTLGRRAEPFAAGWRALWIAGVTDALETADERLGSGDADAARQAYLDLLERAPGHTEALLALAELDVAATGRGESALSFLAELEGEAGSLREPQTRARLLLAQASALSMTGRDESVTEVWGNVLDVETDAVVAALVGLRIFEQSTVVEKKRAQLDQAAVRAPFLEVVRSARMDVALQQGDLRAALADAEYLEASQSTPAARASTCLRVGRAFLASGHHEIGRDWLIRAIRLDPDNPSIMLRLGRCLAERGQHVRACELLQTAVRRFDQKKDELVRPIFDGDDVSARAEAAQDVRVELSEARFLLAGMLLDGQGGGDLAGQRATAVSHLAAVETRSPLGAVVRLTEAEIHNESRHTAHRDRALLRAFEAHQMGWVDLEVHRPRLRRILETLNEPVDPSVLEQMRAFLELGAH